MELCDFCLRKVKSSYWHDVLYYPDMSDNFYENQEYWNKIIERVKNKKDYLKKKSISYKITENL